MLALIIQLLLLVLVYASCWFIASVFLKRNDIADIAWGLGFILIGIFLLLNSTTISSRYVLIFSLVSLWGLRLSLYILYRNKNKPEDFRYLQWRNEWGKWFYLRSYLQVFLLQAGLMLLISTALVIVSHNYQTKLNSLDGIGLFVWLVGYYFQVVSDYQLFTFKKNIHNKGKIITTGLWKYSRHPNYFGESVMWWGIFIISLSSNNGWFAIISPIVITLLLLKVSGVPLLEEKYKNNSEYKNYINTTSSFIPWLGKK